MRVAICGVGALGSTAAVLLRSSGSELRLVDFDRVDTKNLLAQAHVRPSLGKNKADALKLQLANLWGVTAESFPVRLGDHNCEAVLAGCDLVVDCFDNLASRLVLSAHARRTGVPLVHAAVAADGTFGLVRWDERFVPDAEGAPGQATCEGGEHLPFFGLVAASLARVVQDFLLTGARHDVMVSLRSVTPTA